MESVDGKSVLNPEKLTNVDKYSPEFSTLCSDIASAIQSESLTTIDLIHQLGCLLTHQSYAKREIGVLILANVLTHLNPGFLKTEQVTVLVSYLIEKLKDHHQVVPAAIKGLLACINFKSLIPQSVVKMLSIIFEHVPCQQQQQLDRFNIFQIFEASLRKYPTEVKSLKYDFVYGVISSVDGERDAKNLRYLFSWMPLCLKTVKLGHLSEEMFEVLACYFPVDFKAPPSDTHKITREELADGLSECLTSVADFGENALELVLEKLESDLKIAKEDSLEILRKGCKVYEVSVYAGHSIEIWSQLQKEIFSTNDSNFRMQCLNTLTAIINKLSQNSEQEFTDLLNNIADTLKGNLIPNQKLFFPSSSILVAVAKACKNSSILVGSKIIPLLENTFRITSNSKHKAIILNICIELAAIIINYDVYQDFNVPFLCLQAVIDQDSNLRREGYIGLSSIAKILSKEERNLLYDNLNKSILLDDDLMVRPYILQCLDSLASCYPEEMKSKVIEIENPRDLNQFDNYLEALCFLTKLTNFREYVVDRLIDYTVTDPKFTTVAVKNINKIVGTAKELDELFVTKDFIKRLIQVVIVSNNQNVEVEFLRNLSSTLNKLMRGLSNEQQFKIFSEKSKIGLQDDKLVIAVFKGLLIPMKPDCVKLLEEAFVDQLLKLSLESSDVFVKETTIKILANLINKMEDGFLLEEQLIQIKEAYRSNTHTRHDILSWVTKALVIRNHPKSNEWIDQILELLENYKEMCDGLKIILNDSFEELSLINHCQVTPLYRQKFYVYCTNKIAEKYEPQKSNYLIAIGCLIEYAPNQAIAAQFKKILKLVIHCLEKCNDETVLVNLLRRIHEFVEKRETSIEDNLEDFLLRVLDLTVFESCMKVRIAALQCLSKFAQCYEVYKLLPLKDKVIKHLGKCVDDKKRLVRKEAMETRSFWFLLDALI